MLWDSEGPCGHWGMMEDNGGILGILWGIGGQWGTMVTKGNSRGYFGDMGLLWGHYGFTDGDIRGILGGYGVAMGT